MNIFRQFKSTWSQMVIICTKLGLDVAKSGACFITVICRDMDIIFLLRVHSWQTNLLHGHYISYQGNLKFRTWCIHLHIVDTTLGVFSLDKPEYGNKNSEVRYKIFFLSKLNVKITQFTNAHNPQHCARESFHDVLSSHFLVRNHTGLASYSYIMEHGARKFIQSQNEICN